MPRLTPAESDRHQLDTRRLAVEESRAERFAADAQGRREIGAGRQQTLTRTATPAEAALESIGYRLLAVEIDTDAGIARVEVRRHDGYTLTLDWRNGAGTITRERTRESVVATGRRGDRFLARRLSMEFLGRTRVIGGARAALRAFADTIGENATTGRLGARDAIRLLLTPES